MRVLHVAWEHPPVVYGGLGHLVADLAAAQAAAGHQVGVLALGHDVTGADRLRDVPAMEVRDGVRVQRVPLPGAPDGPWSGTDLVDAAAALADPVAASGGRAAAHRRRRGRPLARLDDGRRRARPPRRRWARRGCTACTPPSSAGGPAASTATCPALVHRAERAAVQAFSSQRRPDVVLVCSEAMRTEVVGVLGADPSRVHVVPAAVDAAAWVAPPADADRARALWVPADGPLLVAAGRLEWEKGFSTVLRALPGRGTPSPGRAARRRRRRLVPSDARGAGGRGRRRRPDDLDGLARARTAARAAVGGRAPCSSPAATSRSGWWRGRRRPPVRPSSSPRSAVSPRPSSPASPACGSPPATSTTSPRRCRRLLAEPRRATSLGEAGRAAVQAWTPAAMAEATTALYPA